MSISGKCSVCLVCVLLQCVINTLSEDVVVSISTTNDHKSPQETQTEQDTDYEYIEYPQYNYNSRIVPQNNIPYKPQLYRPPGMPNPMQPYRPHPNAPNAQRKFVKKLKKKKKKKFKKLKKYIQNCGYPHMFKFVQHQDDDGDGHQFDTVKINLMDEEYSYNPKEQQYFKRRSDDGNVTYTDNLEKEDDDSDEYDDDEEDANENTNNIKITTAPVINKFPTLQRPPLMHRNPAIPSFPRPIYPPPPHPMYRPLRPPMPLPLRHPPLPPIPHPMFGPPRIAPWMKPVRRYYKPKININKYEWKQPIPLTKIPETTTSMKPVVANRTVERIIVDNRQKVTSNIVPQIKPTSSYQTLPNYNTIFNSPSHTAFSNPNTYNKKYSQPDYSLFGSYDTTSTTEVEKVVTVTPSSVWEGQPIFVVDTTTTPMMKFTKEDAKNSTRIQHVRRLGEKKMKGATIRYSSRVKDGEGFVTYPPEDHLQVNSPIKQQTSGNTETQQTSIEETSIDIITANYPLDDINNLRLAMNNPRNLTKAFVISRDNMNKFGVTKGTVFFNKNNRRDKK